jgi:hypothetical protein
MNSARKVHKAKNLLDPGTGITQPPGSTSQIRSQGQIRPPNPQIVSVRNTK